MTYKFSVWIVHCERMLIATYETKELAMKHVSLLKKDGLLAGTEEMKVYGGSKRND